MPNLTLKERELRISRAFKVDDLKRECNRRIGRLFDAEENILKEFRVRMSLSSESPEVWAKLESWKVFYKKRYREIKYWILNQNTKNQIDNLDVSLDSYWDSATWIPLGEDEVFDTELPEEAFPIPENDPPSA